VTRSCASRLYVCALAGLAVLLAAQAALAQEQFYTQSGGRGLQNAKTNARLSKVETDVTALNAEMAKIQPHAKAQLGACTGPGEKLRFDGNNWICESETDPTVQEFAKRALPSCGGGSILGVSGGQLSCVDAGYLSNETDPTVQAFAKAALPTCGTDQVLSVQNGALRCMTYERGIVDEQDPNVHDFARRDVAPALPNCNTTQVLTMVGGRLQCKTDDKGIAEEVDPRTASFARTDIAGYTLAACGAGEMLRTAANADGKVILECVAVSGMLAETLALNDLSDVDTSQQVSGTVLMYTGAGWEAMPERDPTVSPWAKGSLNACAPGEVLTYDGTALTCVADAGGSASPLTLAGLSDVDVAAVVNGKFLKYNGLSSKWEPGTVQDFAQAALPTCSTGQVLTGDGTNLTCTADAGGADDPLDLVELGDVRTGPGSNLVPANQDFLRWNSSASKWEAVHDKLSGTLTNGRWCYYDGTDVVCDRGAPLACATGEMLRWNSGSAAFECAAAGTALGLGDMALQNSNSVVIHGGTIDGTVIGGGSPAAATFTTVSATTVEAGDLLVRGNGRVVGDLTVEGSLSISGTQTIEGVTFAKGGVSATGIVSATGFSGDGSGLTNLSSANIEAVGVPGSVQFKGPDGKVSGTAALVWDPAAAGLDVAGTVKVAGSGGEVCTPADYGRMRVVDVGGSDYRMQFCRP